MENVNVILNEVNKQTDETGAVEYEVEQGTYDVSINETDYEAYTGTVEVNKDVDTHRDDRCDEENRYKLAGDLHVGKEIRHSHCLPQVCSLRCYRGL